MKLSANQRPSLLRAESPERKKKEEETSISHFVELAHALPLDQLFLYPLSGLSALRWSRGLEVEAQLEVKPGRPLAGAR